MAKLNEIKEQKGVVSSVGDFAGSLQQIAASRMAVLRKQVLASRRFVDESTIILKELKREQERHRELQLAKIVKNYQPGKIKQAIIVITSSQGLCGSYNTEIFKKIDEVVPENLQADYFVIGSKGQDYFINVAKKYKIKFYPYNIPETVSIDDLKSLVRMFPSYEKIGLIYSKFINTVTRDPSFIDLAVPPIKADMAAEELEVGKFIFEPDIDQLVHNVTEKIRYALFRQQILDSRLSLYTAQMIAMQTASDNAKELLKELQMEYNKARRKMIDKKIQEVQAGRALWGDE